MRKTLLLSIFLLICSRASAIVIDFNTALTPEGTFMGSQFAGVSFAASPASLALGDPSLFYGSLNPGNTTWANNTDLTVTGTDLGAVIAPGVGRVLHSLSAWQNESGNPNFVLNFAQPISSITIRFSGDSTGASGMAVFNAAAGTFTNAVRVAATPGTDIDSVTLSGLNATSILVVPGSFLDWAAVVDISYTVIPEPTTTAILALAGAVGVIVLLRRRSPVTR